jgi:hypothetical protein
MDSASLIQIIQQDARPLVESLYAELRTNLGTSHYHRLSNEELFRRGQAVYQNLADWLASRDEAAVKSYGEDLGRRRFAENIPLGQVVLALILNENHLWDHVSSLKQPADETLRRHVADFFARTIYYTAHGYERQLAAGDLGARTAAVLPQPAGVVAAKAPPIDTDGIEISRGGDVGELGG